MRSVLRKSRNQRAVYWAKVGNDSHGQPTFAAGVALMVRWVEKQEQLKTFDGREIISEALVWAGIDVTMEGALFLGEWYDLTAEQKADPSLVDDAKWILKFEKIPSVSGKEIARKAWLGNG